MKIPSVIFVDTILKNRLAFQETAADCKAAMVEFSARAVRPNRREFILQ
jgi:hypothetical protein